MFSKKQNIFFSARKIVLFFFIPFLSVSSFFAALNPDSLKVAFQKAANDTVRVDIWHQLYQVTDSVNFAQKALDLAQKIWYKKGISQASLDLGRWYYFAGKEDVALKYLINAEKIAIELNNKHILKNVYRYIGFIYRPREPFKAKEYYEKSFRMCVETDDQIGASYVLSAIGNIYEGIYDKTHDNNKKALDYYLKSLKIREEKGSPSEIASSYNETSRVYDELGMRDKASELRIKGLAIAEKTNDAENIVYLCGVLGDDANRRHDYKAACKYYLKAYETGKGKLNNYILMYDVTRALAACYYKLGNDKLSNQYFIVSDGYNDSIKARTIKTDYNLSEMKQNLEKELEKQKFLLKDAEILNQKEKAEKQTLYTKAYLVGFLLVLIISIILYRNYITKQRTNLQLDIRNRELEKAYHTLEVSESKFKQMTETINDVFYLYNIVEKKYEYISPNCLTVLGLDQNFFYSGKSMKAIVHKDDLNVVVDANVLVDSGIAYDIHYRIIYNNEIRWIAEKSSPIFDKDGKLVKNSGICRDITYRKSNEELIRKKNKDITNSIAYGRVIQKAVLTPIDKIKERLNQFFVMVMPKEIVSGDFYFYKATKKGVYVAAVDCTGHGVPAGFMSMIGNSFLNEIINTNADLSPAEVLDELRELVIEALHQDQPNAETKDGMDIALLKFDNKLKTVQYAGAFNPLYIMRKNELIIIEPDLFTIGMKLREHTSGFTNHNLDLQKGDTLYVFSDGYTSQFGGPEGKKFSRKQFQNLLLSLQDKSMPEQEKQLIENFNNWKGNLEQIDDVSVIGVRV